MKLKKLLAILSACSLSVMSVPLSTANVMCTSAEDVTRASVEETENSGSCGENVYWEFDESTGTLTISGTGEMDDDYVITSFGTEAPWCDKEIQNVVIEEGVTSIGRVAFALCESLTSVTIPDSVKSIDEKAFAGCKSLTSITIENPFCDIYGDNTISNHYNGHIDSSVYIGTIFGYDYSTAQRYAEENGYKFESLGSYFATTTTAETTTITTENTTSTTENTTSTTGNTATIVTVVGVAFLVLTGTVVIFIVRKRRDD